VRKWMPNLNLRHLHDKYFYLKHVVGTFNFMLEKSVKKGPKKIFFLSVVDYAEFKSLKKFQKSSLKKF
jgi:hypothetical protein